MYTFQANAGRRKNKKLIRMLYVIIFILAIALIGLGYSFVQAAKVSSATSDALLSRSITEAASAQNAVYRLTQSSGTNTSMLLATIRGHIYAMQSLNAVAANIYGAGTVITDAALLNTCINTLNSCDTRLQAGSVMTDLFTQLRDEVDAVVATFSDDL